MPTLIIVEDGTSPDGANSYVDVELLKSLANTYGWILASDETELEQGLLRAMLYLESRAEEFQGYKTESTQPLQWPRTGACVNCNGSIDSTTIPEQLKLSQAMLSMQVQNGRPLFPDATLVNRIEGPIKKKQIGPLIKEFYDAGDVVDRFGPTKFPEIESQLQQIMSCGCRSGAGVYVSRG